MNLFGVFNLFATVQAVFEVACSILGVFVLIKAYVALDVYIKKNR